MVGVGRINMAVPKPHAGAWLSWVQEVCPSAEQLRAGSPDSPIGLNWGHLEQCLISYSLKQYISFKWKLFNVAIPHISITQSIVLHSALKLIQLVLLPFEMKFLLPSASSQHIVIICLFVFSSLHV